MMTTKLAISEIVKMSDNVVHRGEGIQVPTEWAPVQKTMFIDSVMYGNKVGSLTFHNGVLIDGINMFNALKEFKEDKILYLTDQASKGEPEFLYYEPEYLYFSQLVPEEQEKFLNYEIDVNITGTKENQGDLFSKLNG
ncbi:hypothetical protein M2277_005058 [Paenibacillus sp. LBL]|uniref:hypothetical protein n=1 Tax=Paenibacillus sp. LBL TaxID=2940563 RepID=UPI0024736AFB|nr:hypothetical protein [Paenibacillus sp. LBL]MDH6674366.1 hypothetical protein [Paenibacillus sp. LBL]